MNYIWKDNTEKVSISKVKVRESGYLVKVPVTSKSKPALDELFLKKWQRLVDLSAKIMNVPAGLIMQLHEDQIEVLLASDTKGNPYEVGEKADLGIGLYCETVVAKRSPLMVENALAASVWQGNPDVELKMISYLGVPIVWPDGEVFGTFCVLDARENSYSDVYLDLLLSLRELVEGDLKNSLDVKALTESLNLSDLKLREVNHRIKNQFNILISYLGLYGHLKKMRPTEKEILDDIHSRVGILSKVHQNLSNPADSNRQNLCRYLQEVGDQIVHSSPLGVDLSVSGSVSGLAAECLVPMGLILNELVTNSLKHAFHKSSDPRIEVTLVEKLDLLLFEYRDNGPGFIESRTNSKGLGSLIIESLTLQLGATQELLEGEGYGFRLTMPHTPQEQ